MQGFEVAEETAWLPEGCRLTLHITGDFFDDVLMPDNLAPYLVGLHLTAEATGDNHHLSLCFLSGYHRLRNLTVVDLVSTDAQEFRVCDLERLPRSVHRVRLCGRFLLPCVQLPGVRGVSVELHSDAVEHHYVVTVDLVC